MNKTRRPMSTSTKTAAAAVERYARLVLETKTANLKERAEEDSHGPRWIQNRLNALLQDLDAIRSAPGIESLNISVEWKKSYMWGSNPTATATLVTDGGKYHRAAGRASGCGYDKESAAIAEALNQFPAVKRLLIVAAAAKRLPYGGTVGKYGAHLNGGVGVSCFRNIFESCGYKWESVGSGRTFDAYHVTR